MRSTVVGVVVGGFAADGLRSSFPALAAGGVHFDGPGGTQVPRQVSEAIAACMMSPIANRGVVTRPERFTDQVTRAARAAVHDAFGGVDTHAVVFGRSATQLLFDLASWLESQIRPGAEFVLSPLDHDANVRPWVRLAERTKAAVRWIEVGSDFDLPVESVTACLTDRTRLVALTGASNLVGTMPDLPAIGSAAHERGAFFVVDAVHLAAHEPVDVATINADFMVASPYKLFGPHLGVLVGRSDLLERLEPAKLKPSTNVIPERFELGTLPYELLAGVTATVDFVASLGPEGGSRADRFSAAMGLIGQHELLLREQIENGLHTLPVTVWSRAARRTPTVLMTAAVPASDISRGLAAKQIYAPAGTFYVADPGRIGLPLDGGLRIGIAPYNSTGEVERLLDALNNLVL